MPRNWPSNNKTQMYNSRKAKFPQNSHRELAPRKVMKTTHDGRSPVAPREVTNQQHVEKAKNRKKMLLMQELRSCSEVLLMSPE